LEAAQPLSSGTIIDGTGERVRRWEWGNERAPLGQVAAGSTPDLAAVGAG